MKIIEIIREIPVTSFAHYLKVIEDECKEKHVLFRGQREYSARYRTLLPKIARPELTGLKGSRILSAEKRLFSDFKKRAIPYIEKNVPENDWEWLTLAQHHGLLTRLLDWTRTPLAALWFVVDKPPKDYKTYGIVWIFKPSEDDFVDFIREKSPFDIKKTKVFEPTHIARRITAQAACFTVHKYLDDRSKFIPLDKNVNYKAKLLKVIIPGKIFIKLRSQLDRCGINNATIFADLDSLCKYISWKELR